MSVVKNPLCQRRDDSDNLMLGKILRKEKATHSVVLPGKSQDREAWWVAVHLPQKEVEHDLATT